MRRISLVSVFILIVALTLSGLSVAAEPIKFGAVNPLGDITGFQTTRAMELAIKEINEAGGLLGRPVELIVVDDEMRPEIGAAAIDRLATVDNVDFFVGGMSSGVHLAQVPTLKKYEKITVWMGGASHQIEIAMGPDADWYFHLHPWDYQQGASYGQGWTDIAQSRPDISASRIFLAYEEGAFGTDSYLAYQALYEDAKEGEGPYGQILNEFAGASFTSALLGGGDYRAMLRQAMAFNPDLFIWAGYDADAVPMVAQAMELGFEPPLYVGAPPGWPANFGQNPLSDGVILYGMWAPALKEVSPISKHFWDGYIAMHGHEPATYFAPLGYTNIMFIAEAVKAAGTLEKDAVIEALRTIEYESPIGAVLKIQPSNIIPNQGFTSQKILQYIDGEQHVIWPFDYATSEIKYPFGR